MKAESIEDYIAQARFASGYETLLDSRQLLDAAIGYENHVRVTGLIRAVLDSKSWARWEAVGTWGGGGDSGFVVRTRSDDNWCNMAYLPGTDGQLGILRVIGNNQPEEEVYNISLKRVKIERQGLVFLGVGLNIEERSSWMSISLDKESVVKVKGFDKELEGVEPTEKKRELPLRKTHLGHYGIRLVKAGESFEFDDQYAVNGKVLVNLLRPLVVRAIGAGR